MNPTLLDMIETLRDLMSDPKDQKWLKSTKTRFINSAITDTISSKTKSYIRVAEIPMRDQEYEYEFPADMLEPKAMMIQRLEGSLVLSTSWRSMVGNIGINSLLPYDSPIFWRMTNNFSGHVSLRDLTSDNKFIFSPYYDAVTAGGGGMGYNNVPGETSENTDPITVNGVVKQDGIPNTAGSGMVWVDTLNGDNSVYLCTTGYSAVADQASGVIDAVDRPGSVPLTFTYNIPGVKYVRVVVNQGDREANPGSNSYVTITGDADDRGNPLTYTYTIFDDQNTNDAILSISASNLTVLGSDATLGDVTELSFDLTNDASENWEKQIIYVRYLATYPKLANDTDELMAEIPTLVRNSDCIPLIAATKILQGLKGDDRYVIMYRQYKAEYEDILKRAHGHKKGNGAPHDLEPG